MWRSGHRLGPFDPSSTLRRRRYSMKYVAGASCWGSRRCPDSGAKATVAGGQMIRMLLDHSWVSTATDSGAISRRR
jgi:hypothetical protein